MNTKFNAVIWRAALIVMTLSLWVSLIAAQDEVVAAEETTNFGSIWTILVVGLIAIAALGFLMNSGNSSNDGDN